MGYGRTSNFLRALKEERGWPVAVGSALLLAPLFAVLVVVLVNVLEPLFGIR